ncbi:MAG: glycerophosphodiester phosphodiesterase [Bacteroidetes bacterium]|nr:glycerophosphodiester phosphodiesterase [Bacteroidota bacterium]
MEAPETKTVRIIDWQGHRGCRGLIPENTLIAFTNALDFPEVTTLEMDVVISADSQVVVSHEPWMSGKICTDPEGNPVSEETEQEHNLYKMNYSEIRKYDCGRRPHPDFPNQQKIPAIKPTLSDIFLKIGQYCQTKNRELPQFNIELKSRPSWDNVYTPAPEAFVALVLKEIQNFGRPDKIIIQSFDPRILREVKKQAPELRIAWLTESPNIGKELKELGLKPDIYSPYHIILNEDLVVALHKKDIQVIPWTVNEPNRMQELIDMGVDGIITDYPNRINPKR